MQGPSLQGIRGSARPLNVPNDSKHKNILIHLCSSSYPGHGRPHVLVHVFPGHSDTAVARGGVALLQDGRAAHADRQGQAQAEDRPQGQAQARVQAFQRPQEQVRQTSIV